MLLQKAVPELDHMATNRFLVRRTGLLVHGLPVKIAGSDINLV